MTISSLEDRLAAYEREQADDMRQALYGDDGQTTHIWHIQWGEQRVYLNPTRWQRVKIRARRQWHLLPQRIEAFCDPEGFAERAAQEWDE